MAWLASYNRRKAIATVLDDDVKTDFQLPVTVFKGSPVSHNGALYCDGTDDYAKGLLTAFPVGKADFSIEGWINFDDVGEDDWRSVLNIVDDANARFMEFRLIRAAGVHTLRGLIFTGVNQEIVSDAPVSAGTWYHLVMTYDADGDAGAGHGRMYFYLNAVAQTKTGNPFYDITADPSHAAPLRMRMGIKHDDIEPLGCYFQEIRLSDCVRTQTEVTAAYNGGDGTRLTADENTVGLYHCDNGRWESYDVVYDAGVFYGTHLTLETLANDDLICYYYKGAAHWDDFGNSSICYRTSNDNGETWSAETTILASVALHFIAMGGGGKTPADKYILFYMDRVAGDNGELWAFPPSNDGTTWGAANEILDYANDIILATARMISVESKLFQPLNRYAQPGSVESLVGIWSPDGGTTWGTWDYDGVGGGTQNQYTIIKEDNPKRPTEPSFVYLGSGKIIGLARTNATGEFYQIKSDDYGETWGAFEATGWKALDWVYVANGSMVQIELYGNLIFATVNNRETRRYEVKIVDVDEAWADATVWGTAPKHDYYKKDTGEGWLGYCSVKLVSGNTAPMYHIAYTEADNGRTYQRIRCAVPQTPWDGRWSYDFRLYDDSKYDQALYFGDKPLWTTGKFSSSPSDGYNQLYLGGNCLNAFTDIRPTKLDGTTKLYHYIESKTDGIVGEFIVEAHKAGSVKLDTNADSGQKDVAVTDDYADVVFAADDYVIVKDEDTPDGEVCQIDSINGGTDVITMKSNLVNSYTTAKNARVCHGIYINYDNSGEGSLDAVFHSGSNTFEFFDDAETGVATTLWNENDAGYGDIEYLTTEWRRGAKSLKFTQISNTDSYFVTCDTFANLTDVIISFWAFHDETDDFLLFYGRDGGPFAFNHSYGRVDSNLYYHPGNGDIDVGWDYANKSWEKYTMLCTTYDDVVIWKQFRNVIATDAHRSAWDHINELMLGGSSGHTDDYWYLDEILVSQYAPTLTYDVGSEEEAPALGGGGGLAQAALLLLG